MADLTLDTQRYYRYDEIVAFLREATAAYPELVRAYSIGRSYEGRDIWMTEVTNTRTGPAADKPALYIDANHHAGEVTGSAVALYTLWLLVTRYGKHDGASVVSGGGVGGGTEGDGGKGDADKIDITRLLDTTAVYILPRIAVDGSELYLTTPQTLRSGPRPWPDPENAAKPGLYPEDIDGDGMILQMRVPDPAGEWKVSAKDPRLMVRRGPGEQGGTYYRLYPEGLIRKWDGGPFEMAPTRFGLDFNRNYPAFWELPTRQPGSGDFPLSEAESRAVVGFLSAHPNVGAVMSYHTSGGMILRPLSGAADERMPRRDFAVYRHLGEKGQAATGYPCWSLYESFITDKTRSTCGDFIQWVYEYRGMVSFATELWDMGGRAGLKKRDAHQQLKVTEKEREEDGAKLLAWNDQTLSGEGFVPWRRFDHPQLGPVELGGFLPKTVRQNPPPALLEDECRRNALFTLILAAALPQAAIKDWTVDRVSGSLYRLRVTVANVGYLGTAASDMAVSAKSVGPCKVSLTLDNGVFLVHGQKTMEIGHLDGRSASLFGSPGTAASSRRLEWLLEVKSVTPPGGKAAGGRQNSGGTPGVVVTFDGARGGKASARIPMSE